jgi:hypothetical protein
MTILAAASTVAIALGLLRMPFGYYTLLRVVLCLTSAVGVAAAHRRADLVWLWVYAALVVIYNPILPLKLGSKDIWIGLNLVSLVCIWAGVRRFRGAMKSSASASSGGIHKRAS